MSSTLKLVLESKSGHVFLPDDMCNKGYFYTHAEYRRVFAQLEKQGIVKRQVVFMCTKCASHTQKIYDNSSQALADGEAICKICGYDSTEDGDKLLTTYFIKV